MKIIALDQLNFLLDVSKEEAALIHSGVLNYNEQLARNLVQEFEKAGIPGSVDEGPDIWCYLDADLMKEGKYIEVSPIFSSKEDAWNWRAVYWPDPDSTPQIRLMGHFGRGWMSPHMFDTKFNEIDRYDLDEDVFRKKALDDELMREKWRK